MSQSYTVVLNSPADRHHKHFPSNTVTTSKYTWWSFVPKSIIEQFRKISNLYFLFVLIVNIIPGVAPVQPVTSIIPLVFVVGVAMVKEAVEDWNRHKADRETNGNQFNLLTESGVTKMKSAAIKAGNILKINNGEFFPADLVLLRSSAADGICYVETANLDGETNLKLKKAASVTQKLDDAALARLHDEIDEQLPNADLYKYTARYRSGQETTPLRDEQFLQRGARLQNTDYIFAAAVYLGRDTKLSLNQQRPRTKFSRLETLMNWTVIGIFIVQQLICILLAVGTAVWRTSDTHKWRNAWYLGPPEYAIGSLAFRTYLAYFILLNIFIPISLWITMEIVKFIQAYFIEKDEAMTVPASGGQPARHAVAKTSNLNEELGRIQMVFSDKTGTLTRNEMTFRAASIRGQRISGPGSVDKGAANTKGSPTQRFMQVLALAHSLVPCVDEKSGQLTYRTPSPDELALHDWVLTNGFRFLRRDSDVLTFAQGDAEVQVKLLAELEFSSARARMSVLLQEADGTTVLFTKGADSEIFKRLRAGDDDVKATVSDDLKYYSKLGYRTLALGVRTFAPGEIDAWLKSYKEASTSLEDRDRLLGEVYEQLEHDFDLLGCTAIEDQLADEVPETIEWLLRAGIQVWVLTGDKLETAINIALSSRLLSAETELLIIRDHTDREGCEQAFARHRRTLEQKGLANRSNNAEATKGAALIVDGTSLKVIMQSGEDTLVNAMLALAKQCDSVVCCRTTPLQKSLVVQTVKKHEKRITLAIGDGANDVSMIQTAHVGVGIFGKEGAQAAMASDYAVPLFKHLRRLLGMHGRWAMVRCSGVVQFSFYKNISFTLCQVWFALFSGFSGQTLYDQWIITFYNAFFTFLPPFVYGLFEEDLSPQLIEKYPEAYREVQRGITYSWFTVVSWLLEALWVSLAAFFSAYFLFSGRGVLGSAGGRSDDMWTMGLMVAIAVIFGVQISHWHRLVHIGIWGSLLIFIVFICAYTPVRWSTLKIGSVYFSFYHLVQSATFWFYFFLMLAFILLPAWIAKCVQWTYWPRIWQILRERERFGMVDAPRAQNGKARVAMEMVPIA